VLDFYIFSFFSRTARPILTKVGAKHPSAKGIQNCTNKGQTLPYGEIIAKELTFA
jgi:hypothetical protein